MSWGFVWEFRFFQGGFVIVYKAGLQAATLWSHVIPLCCLFSCKIIHRNFSVFQRSLQNKALFNIYAR